MNQHRKNNNCKPQYCNNNKNLKKTFAADSDDSVKDPDYELVQDQRRIESSSEDENIIMDDNENPNKTDIRTTQTDDKQKNKNTTNIMQNTILNEEIDNTAKQMTGNDDRMRQEMLDAIASIVPTGGETPTFVSENKYPTADVQMSTNEETTPAKKVHA